MAEPLPIDQKENEKRKFVYGADSGVSIRTQQGDSLSTTRVDEPSASLTYVGTAAVGTATSSALWRIKRISVSGNVTSIEWADSNTNFDNVWDNRGSLSYG